MNCSHLNFTDFYQVCSWNTWWLNFLSPLKYNYQICSEIKFRPFISFRQVERPQRVCTTKILVLIKLALNKPKALYRASVQLIHTSNYFQMGTIIESTSSCNIQSTITQLKFFLQITFINRKLSVCINLLQIKLYYPIINHENVISLSFVFFILFFVNYSTLRVSRLISKLKIGIIDLITS